MRDRTYSPFTAADRKRRTQLREAATTMAAQRLPKPGAVPMASAPSGPTPPAGGTGNGRGPGTSPRDGVELMASMLERRIRAASSKPNTSRPPAFPAARRRAA